MGDAAPYADSRKLLNDLLEAEALDDEAWLARARQARRANGVPVFSELIRTLTHLRFNETEAESKWAQLLAHRREVSSRLGRDVGLRVAAFDWFVNIDPRLRNPKVLEIAQFERTERSAMTDWLTGLFNRGAFRASSLRELRRAQRYRQQLSFLFFDLDDFKEVNDRHGHETGDTVLREASRLLRQSVRDVDVCARYGGEEFAVLLPETGRPGAAAVAERVRLSIVREFSVQDRGGEPLIVTISGGISVYPEDGEDLGDLLRKADEALYRAKSEGKNRIVSRIVERRQAERYVLDEKHHRLTVTVEGGGKGKGKARSFRARPRDISKTGFGLRSGERVDIGQRLELSLSDRGAELPHLSGSVVRRSAAADAAGEEAFDVGVGLETRCQRDAVAAIQSLSSRRGSTRSAGEDGS